MDAVTALTRLGGVADRATLCRVVKRRDLDAAIAAGRVLRLRRGLYALAEVDEARRAALRASGVVSHLSAALAWGWKVKRPPSRPTVTVPRNRNITDEAMQVRYADLAPDDVVQGRTSRVRTVLDCARALPFDEALCVTDSALRDGKVTRAELVDAAENGPRTHRGKALKVIGAASPKAANPFESTLRAIAIDVPALDAQPQCPVGSIGHADVGDPVLRIAAEAESWEYHGIRQAFDYDIRRYTAMVRCGWLVVRFTWDEVMHRPDYVRAVLLDLVRLRTAEAA